MDSERFEQLKERIKSKGLVISRVPENTRDKFKELAEEEYSGDYGLLLKKILDDSIELNKLKKIIHNEEIWANFMGHWDAKLDYIINKLNTEQKSESKEEPKIKKMLSGKRIELKKEDK